MKKKVGAIVIVGAVLSIIGLLMTIIFGVKAYDDFKNYSKFSEDRISLTSSATSIEIDNGEIMINESDTEDSYIDYKIIDLYEVINKDGKITFRSKKKFIFPLLSIKNKINIYIGSDLSDKDLKIELNAGVLKSTGTINCKTLDINLNAGSIELNDINCTNLNVEINAGELKIKDSEVINLKTEINAGSGTIKSDFEKFDFTVNAGSLDLTAYDTKSDYTIRVSKNAGSCNVSNGGTGSRNINGTVNAGSADFKFTGSPKENKSIE